MFAVRKLEPGSSTAGKIVYSQENMEPERRNFKNYTSIRINFFLHVQNYLIKKSVTNSSCV